MADNYAPLEELRSTLELGEETFADADLTLAITAASRGIDKHCNRRFWADANANQVRHYSPTNRGLLLIDDLIELTSLKSDPTGDSSFPDTWTQNEHFLLEPLNAAADGEPWTLIRVLPQSSFALPTARPRSVKVTGKFGWASVPAGIKEATMVIASKLLRRAREAPFGVVALGIEGGAMRIIRSDPDVGFLIEPFRHIVVG